VTPTESTTSDADRAPGLGLVLALVLALVAGCVDAICFERVFNVFPANQSGNAVVLGIALGHGHGGEAWRPALAIVSFTAGVAVAIALGSRIDTARRAVLLLALEVAMLLPLTMVLLDDPGIASGLGGLSSGVLLALTASAMGIQTEVIGRAAGVAVATTYQTGAITRIGESMARRFAPARMSPISGPGIAVLLVVLAAYVTGAALGAALGDSRFAMAVSVAILAVVGITLAASRPVTDEP
jgi:uncharacterized membrane protein YoaK (UPF0700 family)